MSLSIILPQKADKLSEVTSIDKFLFHTNSSKNRSIVFYDEAIVGYIIYKNSEKVVSTPVYLDITILPADIVENQSSKTLFKATDSKSTAENGNGNGNGNVGSNNNLNNFGILSKTLNEEHVVFQGSIEGDNYKIWRFEVPITYPKKKFTNPRLLLACSLNEHEQSESSSDGNIVPAKSNESLPDYTPDENKNIMNELNNQLLITSLSDTTYSLSNKILGTNKSSNGNETPKTITSPTLTKEHTPEQTFIQSVEKQESLALKASISIPVSASLVIKIKSTKPAGRNNMLLATLNIETSEDLIKFLEGENLDDYYFKVSSTLLEFKFGEVEEIKTEEFSFPMVFKLIDSINLTYKLINNEFLDTEAKSLDTNNNYQFTRPVNIKLDLQVQKYIPELDTMDTISNIITTSWSPYLDFSIIAPPINNLLKSQTYYSQVQSQPQPSQSVSVSKTVSTRKSAMMNSLYKLKSPSGNLYNSSMQNSNSSLASVGSFASKKKNLMGSTASSVTVNLTTNSNSSLSGLKLTFEGKLSIKLGEIINWKIQAINNSNNKLNLSLLVQNPINFNPVYSSNAPTNNVSSSNLINSENNPSSNSEIIIYNKIQLYSLYNSLRINTSGVIILNNDVRIGPLDPNTVFETDIQFIGISKGIFNLDGVKIFDMNSGDGLDFGKLVEVFVV
ncbi:KRE11-like protein [Scheffersomyces coipomensis]|uniref:KRE11-like protein n=1 Tax=Scheffersomyces coipomensis TaxID=1788519 RepID=UPI00315DB34F